MESPIDKVLADLDKIVARHEEWTAGLFSESSSPGARIPPAAAHEWDGLDEKVAHAVWSYLVARGMKPHPEGKTYGTCLRVLLRAAPARDE